MSLGSVHVPTAVAVIVFIIGLFVIVKFVLKKAL